MVGCILLAKFSVGSIMKMYKSFDRMKDAEAITLTAYMQKVLKSNHFGSVYVYNQHFFYLVRGVNNHAKYAK